MLQKFNTFWFISQQVDCLYMLLKYQFSDKFVVKNRKEFDIIQRAVYFIQKPKEWTESPASQKKDSWGKSTENIHWDLCRSSNQSKLVGQSLHQELNKL